MPLPSPTTTTALKLKRRPPFTTLATRLICTTRSSRLASAGGSIFAMHISLRDLLLPLADHSRSPRSSPRSRGRLPWRHRPALSRGHGTGNRPDRTPPWSALLPGALGQQLADCGGVRHLVVGSLPRIPSTVDRLTRGSTPLPRVWPEIVIDDLRIDMRAAAENAETQTFLVCRESWRAPASAAALERRGR